MKKWTTDQAVEANKKLAQLSAVDRTKWAYETFGRGMIMSSSFGIQSAVMLHLASRVYPDIPIIFVDTGYLFKETYLFAHELAQQLNLNLKKYQPTMSAAEQEALYGKLWEEKAEGLEQYNFLRKVEPMNRALEELGAEAWVAGLRRVQSSTRESRQVIEIQNKILKVYPIIDWTDKDVDDYLKRYDLPYHPLWEQGYVSMGDTHSTIKLGEGMNHQDTRFFGMKRECGLHDHSNRNDFQI